MLREKICESISGVVTDAAGKSRVSFVCCSAPQVSLLYHYLGETDLAAACADCGLEFLDDSIPQKGSSINMGSKPKVSGDAFLSPY